MLATVKLDGVVVCWINKRFLYQGIKNYEVSFPIEESLKSLYFSYIDEIHAWLDREYEGWIVV